SRIRSVGAGGGGRGGSGSAGLTRTNGMSFGMAEPGVMGGCLPYQVVRFGTPSLYNRERRVSVSEVGEFPSGSASNSCCRGFIGRRPGFSANTALTHSVTGPRGQCTIGETMVRWIDVKAIKRAVLLFWAAWLSVVVGTNVLDGLRALWALPQAFAFASGNWGWINQ